MLYELHLTTKPETDPSEWEEVCEDLGVKPLHIELAGGNPRNPRQLMTASTHEGHDGSAYAWRHNLIAELSFRGFSVIRAKLEVPLDKSALYDKPVYHEAHVKALVPLHKVNAAIQRGNLTGWIMSRNLLFPEVDGLAKVYFTRRIYRASYHEAGRRFSDSFGSLARSVPWSVRMEMETVVVDNNPALDKGWASVGQGVELTCSL